MRRLPLRRPFIARSRSIFGTRYYCVVAVIFAFVLFGCVTGLAAEPGRIVVVYDRPSNLLSVDAREVPLGLVLLEVSKRTAVTLESRDKALLHEQVSLTLERLPLDRALAELVGRYNAVFSYAPESTTQSASPSSVRIDKVLVLSKKQAVSIAETPAVIGSEPESAASPNRGDGVEQLLDLVAARDAASRQDAMLRLTEQAPDRAFQPLIGIVQDRSEDLQSRIRAAGLLGRIGDPRAVDVLIRAFDEGDRSVQQAAASGLARIGGERSVQFLLRVFSGNDRQLHQTVAMAMAFHGDDRVKAALVQAIGQAQVSVDVLPKDAIDRLGRRRSAR